MQPQGESIWGNINLCIEIALDIYFMIGENRCRTQSRKSNAPTTTEIRIFNAVSTNPWAYLYYLLFHAVFSVPDERIGNHDPSYRYAHGLCRTSG